MKNQTLIFMALSGVCAAATVDSTSQVQSLSTINQNNQDDVSQVLKQISSGEVEFGDPVLQTTDSQVSYDTGLNSTTTNDQSLVTLVNGKPTDQNVNLQSFGSYFNKGSMNPNDYLQNQNSVRSNDIFQLKKQNYQLQDQLDIWGPKVMSTMDETRQNNADTKELQDATEQYANLASTLDQSVQGNSSRLQKLEGSLKMEYEQISALGNSLQSLQQECKSTDHKSQGDVDQINELNNQILLTMTKSHENLTNVSNELKVVSEEYITLNSGFSNDSKNESEQIESLRGQIRKMAKDIEGNYNLANANISQLNSYFTNVDEINDRVLELQQAIDGPIKTKMNEFKQTRLANTRNLKNFMGDYEKLKSYTSTNFDDVRQNQNTAYGHLEDEFSQLEDNLKLQKAANISLKKGMDDQITLTSSQERDTDKNMEQGYSSRLAEEETKLTSYQQIFNQKNQQCQDNLDILRANLERLSVDFSETKSQHNKKVLNLQKGKKIEQKRMQSQVMSLQGSLNQMEAQNEIKLESQCSQLRQDQDNQDKLRQNDLVVLTSQFDALKSQEDKIITLSSSIELGNRKMDDSMRSKYREMKTTIDGFEEQVDQANKDYKKQLKVLQSSIKEAEEDSKTKDDVLKNWIQSTYDEMTEFQTSKDSEVLNLKNIFNVEKTERQKDKRSNDETIKNQLKSWRIDKDSNSDKYKQRLRKVKEDRDQQSLSLQADIGTMDNQVQDIINFICWRNKWQVGAFKEYLHGSKDQAIVQDKYSTSGSYNPELRYEYKDSDKNVTNGELKNGDNKKFKVSKDVKLRSEKSRSKSKSKNSAGKIIN